MSVLKGACPKPATWMLLFDDPSNPYDETYACDEHHEAMKFDHYVESIPVAPARQECCFIQHKPDCTSLGITALSLSPCSCDAFDFDPPLPLYQP